MGTDIVVNGRKKLAGLLIKFGKCLPDKLYLTLQYLLYEGRLINWSKPRTFTEKIQWLKLNNRTELLHILVDKYEVKNYVASQIGKEYIIPTLGLWCNADEIDFSSLPDRFVLKCTHSSHASVVCKDKALLDIKAAKEFLNRCLLTSPYEKYREWAYKDVAPRILAERYIENYGQSDLIDYKFYCFGGQAKFCQVIMNRTERESIDFFNRDWEKQEFIGLNVSAVHAEDEISRPDNYDLMLCIADKLSNGFPFVRVDLYEVGNKVYFGEMTFYPGAGLGNFRPSKWNRILGDYLHI